jgi:CHAT domain-containing protein
VVRGYAATGAPSGLGGRDASRALQPLPGARAEVESVAAALGGVAVLRLDGLATETNFRADTSHPARVLHVAAHAVLDEERGGAAAIVLDADVEGDGLLYAADLAGLSLAVDLALLSACSTTLGAEDDARALESLAGGLLRAGSGAVVATLWDVADADAAAFVEALAWELGRGRDVAGALRRVKLRFRDDPRWASPARWAGWVVIGEPRAVRARSRLEPWMFLAAGLAAVAVVATFARLRRAQGQARKVSASSDGG